jgi:two-component system nitrogen regulation sensor histidine kinase GlnL
MPDTEVLQQLILSNQTTAVLLFDESLKVRYLNSAAEILFGISARFALAQSAARMLYCPDGDGLTSHLQEALLSDQPKSKRETPLVLLDGREVIVDCTLVPLLDTKSRRCVLAEVRQVDLQLRLNREEQLINQNNATRELVRGLAHEIKNPLGGLRGAAQLLAMELDDSVLTEYTQVIINEADRLQVLVDQLLGPRKLPVKEAVNIHHVLEYVLSVVSAGTGNLISITRDYDPSIPRLQGDQDQLIQAFLNIVQNSAQATGDEGRILFKTRVQRHFTLASKIYPLVVQIDITDNGPGVPEELQDKVFYPMVTGKAEGTGLGLSIAQSLINRHAGLIEFSSKPGKTVFTVYLPLE